jgi:hypothetical protein
MANPARILRCLVPSRVATTNDAQQLATVGTRRRRFKSTTTPTSSPGTAAGKEVTTAAAAESSSRFGARLWQLYVRNLKARPLLTKCTFSSLIFFASDSVTQYILPPTLLSAEETEKYVHDDEQKTTKREDGADADAAVIIQLDTNTTSSSSSFWLHGYDAPRALSAAAFGALASCYLHHWWNLLEFVLGRAVPIERYGRLAHTAVKVVIDQGMGTCARYKRCERNVTLSMLF